MTEISSAVVTGAFTVGAVLVTATVGGVKAAVSRSWIRADNRVALAVKRHDNLRGERMSLYPEVLDYLDRWLSRCYEIHRQVTRDGTALDPHAMGDEDRHLRAALESRLLRLALLADEPTHERAREVDEFLRLNYGRACRGEQLEIGFNAKVAELLKCMQREVRLDVV